MASFRRVPSVFFPPNGRGRFIGDFPPVGRGFDFSGFLRSFATYNMKARERYNLYIDECGDHYLATFDRNFPIFTLCGILVPVKKINALKSAVDDLKMEFWNSTDVILHSRDIRKCEKHFQILFDDEIKQRFYSRVNEILARQGFMLLFAVRF